MNDDFLESIKSRGYWRVNVRPTQPPREEVALGACLPVIERASVSLRGWDYPHVPHREGKDAGVERHQSYIQAWTDWLSHREFWRMYRSGQFLHFRALNEDWRDREHGAAEQAWNRMGPGPVLGVTSNLWFIAEVFEFVSRLVQQNPALYDGGAEVRLLLVSGDTRRSLWIDDRTRMPFSHDKATNAPEISYAVPVSAEELADPKTQAERAAKHIFERFGWDASADQLRSEVERLYDL